MNIDAYLPTIVWTVLLLWCLNRHITALRRYSKQARLVKTAEARGHIEQGSTLVAQNQRYRYVVRSVMAVFGVCLGGLGFYAVGHPAIALNPIYGWTVLGYFYVTEALTGWLTVRDLRVLDRIGLIDAWADERRVLHARISNLEAEVADLKGQLKP